MAKRRQEHGYARSLHEPMPRGDLSAWYGWWPERLSAAEVLADGDPRSPGGTSGLAADSAGGEAHFRVLPESAPALRVTVERANGQPSFLRAGPYSISYAAREGGSLAPVEEEFLLDLGARTAEALGSPAAVPSSAASGGRVPQ